MVTGFKGKIRVGIKVRKKGVGSKFLGIKLCLGCLPGSEGYLIGFEVEPGSVYKHI